jgi:SAM-dependent methyltransferase
MYYRRTIASRLASRLAISVRHRIIRSFMDEFNPSEVTKILDLGVTSENDESANMLEKLYPWRGSIVCAGVQPNDRLESAHPGVRFVQVEAGAPLPFDNNHFDIVYSNAVIEHAGPRNDQARFVEEALRVSKKFFITTPNRWFPVEMHTHLPLLHWLPRTSFSSVLKLLGDDFYSKEENLNLLDRRQLVDLFPRDVVVKSKYVSVLGIPSNILVYGDSKRPSSL